MKFLRSLLVSFIVVSIMLSSFVFPASADGDFYWKEHDKAYITFVFDDGQENIEFTQQMFDLFYNYQFPMCCAVVSSKTVNNDKVIDLLRNIEKFGGEIMSHCYNHIPIDETNSNIQNIEKQFGWSYKALTKLGFNITGIIETGNGGGEKKANYEMMEPIVRKYYKYSNAYGTSIQYKGTSYGENRHWLSDYTPGNIEKRIDKAVENKEWIMISAHSFKEYSLENMEKLVSYIDSLGKDKVGVVTWRYMYEKFGVYSGPQIPAKTVLDEIEEEKKIEEGVSSSTSNVTSSEENSSKDISSQNVSSEEELIGMDDSDFVNNTTNTIVTSTETNVSSEANNNIKQDNDFISLTTILLISIPAVLVLIAVAIILILKLRKK